MLQTLLIKDSNNSYGSPGSFNLAVISNKEADLIYNSMNKKAGSLQVAGFGAKNVHKSSLLFELEQRYVPGLFGLLM